MGHDAIALFALCVTVYEIIKFNISKCSRIDSIDLQKVGQYHELKHLRVSHWMEF